MHWLGTMEVIEIHGGLLTNVEVLHILREQAKSSSSSSSAVNNDTATSVDASTTLQNKIQVTEMTVKYISESFPKDLSLQSVRDMLSEIKSSGHLFTEAEFMQIANTIPNSPVRFHAVIEECEDRFSDDAVEHIVAIVVKHCFSS